MKRYIFPLGLILVFVALQACKEPLPEEIISPTPAYCLEEGSEYLIPLVDSCRTQPFPRSGPIWIPPNEETFIYHQPIISSTNPNHIIYQRHQTDTSSVLDQLWMINLCTGNKSLLANNVWSGVIQSATGWMLYNSNDAVWKMNSDGDSLIQLANFFIPIDWHPSGHQIIGRMVDGNWAIVDAEGQLLQVLSSIKNYEALRWSPDGTYLAMQGAENDIAYVYLYEVATGQIEKIPVPTSATWHLWVDNDHMLIRDKAYTGNIVKINIHTHQIVNVLEPFCANVIYFPQSISTDGQYLLSGYNLFEESIPGSSILNRYTKLVVMDIDGGNRREIVVE